MVKKGNPEPLNDQESRNVQFSSSFPPQVLKPMDASRKMRILARVVACVTRTNYEGDGDNFAWSGGDD